MARGEQRADNSEQEPIAPIGKFPDTSQNVSVKFVPVI